VKAKYPNVKFVYGSLHDADVIEKAAAAADIVVRKPRIFCASSLTVAVLYLHLALQIRLTLLMTFPPLRP
jgi:hypothetical protein